jgi:hypothetical protein
MISRRVKSPAANGGRYLDDFAPVRRIFSLGNIFLFGSEEEEEENKQINKSANE